MNQNALAVVELLRNHPHLSDGEKASILNVLTAQNRELEIEAALERIRAAMMAMQKSDELRQVIACVFKQLQTLGFAVPACSLVIYNDDLSAQHWFAGFTQEVYPESYTIPYVDTPYYTDLLAAWQNGVSYQEFIMEGKRKVDYGEWLFEHSDFKYLPDEFKKHFISPDRMILSDAFMRYGMLEVISAESLPGEKVFIVKRFAKVFEQTYTRFLDLQKAEAQAREAIIEAALEKVRGGAMAMHDSKDLSSTASMIFTELRKLGIKPIRCGIGLLDKESRKAQLYSATSSTDGDSLALIGWVILSGHPVMEKIYDAWLKHEDYFPVLSGEQLKSYYELLLSGLPVPSVPDWQSGQKQYGYFLPSSVGFLYAWSENPYTDAEIKILNRFASIIDLTSRRYIELQKSEAVARAAVRQAALNRVRAEIASMRTTSDLDRITPLIWNELIILGVPFIRCGVFIMDEQHHQIQTYLSTPEGKAIATFQLPFHIQGFTQHLLSHWRSGQILTDWMDNTAFLKWADTLVEQGILGSKEQYLTENPPHELALHFIPFLQGMLYVGNVSALNEDEINLVQSLADAFSTAYARYEDFKKLEAAKQQVENTLTELKSTQVQLVQREKMASLGELTAGIAHEIQNPLNFVNNFSEVNTELIFELKRKALSGNIQEVLQIAGDLAENENKIAYHGKRADAIVKGMLQHSHQGMGQKEPTDINALADEYLRLTYHGMRAKDKHFNAVLQTDFDNSIGKVNVVPQDIGRVLLNLFNNAFYAVSEKKKGLIHRFEPMVSVSTKKNRHHIKIRVRDNGIGIPQKTLDKIYQPFFTTKPTGQGTGLGLSLSYDIIKAHGGKLKVDTKEGEYAEFVVQLPL